MKEVPMAELKRQFTDRLVHNLIKLFIQTRRKSAITTKGPFAGDPIFRPTVQKPEVLSLIRLNKE